MKFSARILLVFGFFSLFSFFFSSCISENPNLVNAPIGKDSIRIRLLNLAGDKLSRSLELEGNITTGETTFNSISGIIGALGDSVYAYSLLNRTREYSSSARMRFGRNTFQMILALPSAKTSKPVDSLVQISTQAIPLSRTNQAAYLRVFNASQDTNSLYSLSLGCPNGTPITLSQHYLTLSAPVAIDAGESFVSLLKNNVPIGFYKFTLLPTSDYSMIICPQDSILLLDERGYDSHIFIPLIKVQKSEGFVRVANVSSVQVDVKKDTSEIIEQGIATQSVTNYHNIAVCGSQNANVIDIFSSNILTSEKLTAFSVDKHYTVVVADSGNGTANASVIVPPVKSSTNHNIMIRAVNLSWQNPPINISVGARTSANGNFFVGEVISPALSFGQISYAIEIEPGEAPFVIFGADNPIRLLFAGNQTLIADKNYLAIFTSDKFGSLQMRVISDDDGQLTPFLPLQSGAFTQIANAVPDADQLTFSIDNMLIKNTPLYYLNSFATVLSSGTHTLNVAGKNTTVNSDPTKRTLIVVSGNVANPDILQVITSPYDTNATSFSRRFINACKEIPSVTIAKNDTSDHSSWYVDKLPYDAPTYFGIENVETRVTLFFFDPISQQQYLRTTNVAFLYGKGYTVIFTGKSTSGGYRAIILQEF